MPGGEAAGVRCLPQGAPGGDRRVEAPEAVLAGEVELEQLSDNLVDALRNADPAGLDQRLQPGGKVKHFAGDRILAGVSAAGFAADDHKSRRDAGTAAQRLAQRIANLSAAAADVESAADRAFRGILTCPWPTEISEHDVAEIFGDGASRLRHLLRDRVLVARQKLTEDFRVDASRQCSR